ncbi:sigma-70 family RNA polymerase sigma factor [Streptomyces mayteni]
MTSNAASGGCDKSSGVTVSDLGDDFWEKDLFGFVQRLLDSSGVPSGRLDADDVVQAVWLALHTATTPITWADRYAYTVARRTIVRAALEGRRFTSSLSAPDDALLHEEPHAREEEWNSPVERRLLERELEIAIAAGKLRLTSLQRTVVEETVEQGLPRSEIAARLGVRVGTISAHRARALCKLHDHLSALLFGWILVLGCIAFGLLTSSPVTMAGGGGCLLALLVEHSRRVLKPQWPGRRRQGRSSTAAASSERERCVCGRWWIGWLQAIALLAVFVGAVVLVAVSRSIDGTPGLDYASGDEPGLDRTDWKCLENYPRCPGNDWWWVLPSDESVNAMLILEEGEAFNALQGELLLENACKGVKVRWSLLAGSQQVAFGSLTSGHPRGLTEPLPAGTQNLLLNVERTDSEDCSAQLRWAQAGLR